MGKGRTSRSKKRKYYGNQHATKSDDLSKVDYTIYSKLCKADESITSSSSKLSISMDVNKELMPLDKNNLCGNRIIDIEILMVILASLCCPVCYDNKLHLEENSRFELL